MKLQNFRYYLTSAFLFITAYAKYSFSLKTLFCFIGLVLFLVLSVMDIRYKMISVKYAIALILCGLLFNFSIDSLLGAGVLCLTSCALMKISTHYFEKEVFGEGDIYVLTALGAFTGLSHSYISILLAIFFQFIFCISGFIKSIFEQRNYKLLGYIIWFVLSYILVFSSRLYLISINEIAYFLIFVNVILSSVMASREIIKKIRHGEEEVIAPFSPSGFLSLLIYLLFF